MHDVVEIVRELVQMPSVNPMGQSQPAQISYEHRITRYLLEFLSALNVESQQLPVQTIGSIQRSNVVGWLPGAPDPESAATVVLQAHQDTVPVGGMTIDPFAAEIRNGRIYGRGACDVKGGLGTTLSLASRIVREAPSPRPNVLLAFTMNEEFGFAGAEALGAMMRSGRLLGCTKIPDAIVVAEPTSLNVVSAHKGVIRWRCRTQGVAAHSSRPAQGVNAIYAMSRVVRAIEEYYDEGLLHQMQHPHLGHASISVGTIQGGLSVNTVPDACVIEIDRRTLPSEDLQKARQHLIDVLAALDVGQAKIMHDAPFMQSPGLASDNNTALAERICEIAQQLGQSSEITTASYGTDAAQLARDGAPTVVFGPGHIEQAHTDDEWIEIEQLHAAGEILWDLLKSFAGATNSHGRQP